MTTASASPRVLPVLRSSEVRVLLLASVAITLAILVWIRLDLPGARTGLSPIFRVLFVTHDQIGAIVSLLILAAAALVPQRFPARRLVRWLGEHPLLVAPLAAVMMMIGTVFVYRNHPLSMDEYAPFFQSEAFAAGRLAGHFPPELLDRLIPAMFQNGFFTVSRATGEVASSYWPSFALLLTPFTWAGVPWVCNPLITACTIVVIHRLAVRIFHQHEAAGLAVLLTIASPVFWANGISYYSMPAHLLANSVFMLLLMDPRPVRVFLAGVVGSVALTLHNPVPHLLFAIPWILALAMTPRGMKRIVLLGAGYLPLGFVLGVGWFVFLNGVRYSDVHALDAQLASTAASAFGWPSGEILTARVIGLAKIWLWAVPGLGIVAIAGARRRSDPALRCLTMSALLTLVGFLFVPFDQGHGWGFRYFHSAWMALPLLGTAALVDRDTSTANNPSGRASLTLMVGCAVLMLTVGSAAHAFVIRTIINVDLAQVPSMARRDEVTFIDVTRGFYTVDLVQNDPLLRPGRPMRMISLGKEANASTMKKYFPEYGLARADERGEVWVPPSASQHSPLHR